MNLVAIICSNKILCPFKTYYLVQQYVDTLKYINTIPLYVQNVI